MNIQASFLTPAEKAAAFQSLGHPRFATYLQAKNNRSTEALELYQWTASLAGQIHEQILYLEVALRNSIDEALKTWNATQTNSYLNQPYRVEWTERGNTADPLFSLIKPRTLETARRHAEKAKDRRPNGHSRKNAPTNHDDYIAQLNFGDWVPLIQRREQQTEAQKDQLWLGLYHAFAHAPSASSQATRHSIGDKLERIHRIRNRVAHHENILLLGTGFLDDVEDIINYINPELVPFALLSQIRNYMATKP